MFTKKKATPTKISSLLHGKGQSSHLTRMLIQQHKLLQTVQNVLPENIRSHCLHARIDNKQLILFTDSPVWNTRLRYLIPDLIREIRQLAPGLQTVKIKVLVNTNRKQPISRKATLSTKSAESILVTADTVSDPELRAALQRLGQHGIK